MSQKGVWQLWIQIRTRLTFEVRIDEGKGIFLFHMVLSGCSASRTAVWKAKRTGMFSSKLLESKFEVPGYYLTVNLIVSKRIEVSIKRDPEPFS